MHFGEGIDVFAVEFLPSLLDAQQRQVAAAAQAMGLAGVSQRALCVGEQPVTNGRCGRDGCLGTEPLLFQFGLQCQLRGCGLGARAGDAMQSGYAVPRLRSKSGSGMDRPSFARCSPLPRS